MTFVATLTIQLEFAIFVGVLASLLVYLNRTTHPRLTPVVPDADVAAAPLRAGRGPSAARARSSTSCASTGRCSSARSSTCATSCDARERAPERRHVLLVGSGINFIDVAGAELLVAGSELMRDSGGFLYLCNLKPAVREVLERGGFLELSAATRLRHQGRCDSRDLRAARSGSAAASARRASSTSARRMLPDGSRRVQ